jgi:hypothetical protein
MSGRLVILPKKSYCPWNPKNVARVERDERDHREAQERIRQRETQEQSKIRIDTLKQRQQRGGDKDDDNQSQQRFNLFEREEREHLRKSHNESHLGHRKGNGRKESGRDGREETFRDIMTSKTATSPFYMLPAPPREEALSVQETRRKETMDPMNAFHCTHKFNPVVEAPLVGNISSTIASATPSSDDNDRKNSSRKRHRIGRRHQDSSASEGDDQSEFSSGESSSSSRHRGERKRKKKKKKRRKKSKRRDQLDEPHDKYNIKRLKTPPTANSADDSIDELRRRRAERQEKERKRQESILDNSKSDLQGPRYLDQYNPGFSRK